MDVGTISLILLFGLFALLAIGMPLGFASGFLAVVTMVLKFGPDLLFRNFGTGPLGGTNSVGTPSRPWATASSGSVHDTSRTVGPAGIWPSARHRTTCAAVSYREAPPSRTVCGRDPCVSAVITGAD